MKVLVPVCKKHCNNYNRSTTFGITADNCLNQNVEWLKKQTTIYIQYLKTHNGSFLNNDLPIQYTVCLVDNDGNDALLVDLT